LYLDEAPLFDIAQTISEDECFVLNINSLPSSSRDKFLVLGLHNVALEVRMSSGGGVIASGDIDIEVIDCS
jgi:hypothetical protein